MLKRTITAVVAIALFIPVCIYSDTVVFPAVMALLSVIGVFEMLGCVGVRKHYILAGISLVFGAMPIVPFFAGESTLKIIAALCEHFGTPIEGTPFYAFPTAERLASAGTEGLARVRCGFRAKYVADAAEKVASGTLDLQVLRNQPYEAAKAALMTIYGVGTKVADCVLLFSLGFYEAFPIDVWVKKVISKYYGKSFDGSRFGAYAGIAQQYLFYYERSICGR